MDAESLAQIEKIVSGAEGRLRQEYGKKTEKLSERIEDVRQYSGVLHEEVLRRIDLVVEGHQGLHQKIERLESRMEDGFARIEREFLETRALIQLSYRQLQDRVETLEQRVQLIEKRLGLSN